jgi:hypothetical protein
MALEAGRPCRVCLLSLASVLVAETPQGGPMMLAGDTSIVRQHLPGVQNPPQRGIYDYAAPCAGRAGAAVVGSPEPLDH